MIKTKYGLYFLLLLLCGKNAEADPAKPVSGNAGLKAAIHTLMSRAFSSAKKRPSDYLITADDDNLQQQYVNGASPLYGDDIQQGLVTSLSTFNSANAAQGVELFAFTGRTYLGYTDIRGFTDTSAAVQKIMNGLSSGLQHAPHANANAAIFRKDFIQQLDDQYAAFQKTATAASKPKLIVMFYVEAVLGHDYVVNNTLTPAQKKHYYCFIWTGGLNVFEQSALSGALTQFRQLLKLDPKQGLSNPQGLVDCLNEINTLYQGSAGYDNPDSAIKLVWTLSADNQLSSLDIPSRIRLLKAINKASSLTDANNVFATGSTGFSGEQAVVMVTSTVQQSQGAEWMDSLQANTGLVVGLLDKVDNAGMGDNNYTSLVFSILKYFYAQTPFNGDWSQFNADSLSFQFNGMGMYDGLAYTMSEEPSQGLIGGTIHMGTGMDYMTYGLSPFRYIGVMSKVALPGLTYSTSWSNGYSMSAVPAFYLSWVLHQKNNANATQLLLLAVAIPGNAVVFGTGFALLESGNVVLQVIGGLDVVSSVTSTVLQTTPLKEAIGAKYGTTSTQYQIINDIDLAMGIYNGARVITDMAGLPQDLQDAAKLWPANRQGMLNDGAITEQQADQIDELLTDKQSADVAAATSTDTYFKDADAFAATYDKNNTVSETIRGQAFDLYKQHQWSELQTLFKENNLNGGWPPGNGGYNIVDNVPITAGQVFDRYGNAVREWNGQGSPILGGTYTSPVVNGTPYGFGQRALDRAENQFDFYYEIEVLKDLPFTGQSADVIPWFGQAGGGKQTMWYITKNKVTGFPQTWNELVEEGYIKVTIKKSPSGKFTNLENTTIQ